MENKFLKYIEPFATGVAVTFAIMWPYTKIIDAHVKHIGKDKYIAIKRMGSNVALINIGNNYYVPLKEVEKEQDKNKRKEIKKYNTEREKEIRKQRKDLRKKIFDF